MYGTRRRVHVKSVYPYRVPFREIVVHRKRLVPKDLEVRVPLPYGLKNLPVRENPLVKLSNCRFMSISSDRPTGRQDRLAQEAEMTERFQRIRLKSSELGRTAQLVEHIVHIDGVTGSSPVATTTSPWKLSISEGFLFAFDDSSPLQRESSTILLPSTNWLKIRTL